MGSLFWKDSDMELEELYSKKKYKDIYSYVDDNKDTVITAYYHNDPSDVLDNLEFGNTMIYCFADNVVEKRKNYKAIFEIGVLKGYVEAFAERTSNEIQNRYALYSYDLIKDKEFFMNICKILSSSMSIYHGELAEKLNITSDELITKMKENQGFYPFIHTSKQSLRLLNHHRYKYSMNDCGHRLLRLLKQYSQYDVNGISTKWISVTDKQPNDNNLVYVTVEKIIKGKDTKRIVYKGRYIKEERKWYNQFGVDITSQVLAWKHISIPTPYEGD